MPLVKAAVDADLSGLAALGKYSSLARVTKKAVKAGAQVLQKAAKARVRAKRTGALKQSIGVKAAKGKRGKTVALAVVGPRKSVEKTLTRGRKAATVKPAFYAHLVEKGTRPHSVAKAARLGRERGRGKGKVFVPAAGQGGGGQHPGAKAQPFLGPAYESSRAAIAAAVEKAAAAELAKELTKQAAKAARG